MNFIKKHDPLISLISIVASTILVYGCAFDVLKISKNPVLLDDSLSEKPILLIEENLEITLSTGYKRTLKSGTKWHYVGQISYGDIYKTKDQILTIEGSNIYEAFIVVSEEQLVGFYLPVEQSFSPLSDPLTLKYMMVD